MTEGPLGRPAPRAATEIFSDLRVLAQTDGALHGISALVYRDWVLTVDIKEGRVVDAPELRWSTSKLNKNELLLLLGLTVQSPTDRIYSIEHSALDFASRADGLLREFHDLLIADLGVVFDPEKKSLVGKPESIGLFAREAIYYGADSFYLHQLSRYSRLRYREDADWMLRKIGISIRPIVEIANFICQRITRQMGHVGHLRQSGQRLSHGELTNSLLVAKSELHKKFGTKADAFISRFSIPATNANLRFDNPFAVNAAAISPLVDLGDCLYVSNQYRLFETIYESPFYWMLEDQSYKDKAADNRGIFLEGVTAHTLRSVFGRENVYENVVFHNNSKSIGGEADVLVVYGEFVLVVQAKSKRVTLKARSGDIAALSSDFEGAVQAPYNQAIACADLIAQGAECASKDGRIPKLPRLARVFPVVILSDPFPSSTLLSGKMLSHRDGLAPVIWDIGVLDCVARILPTPIEMLFYLKSRSEAFHNVLSDSEYNFLGYHLRAKLVLPQDVDGLMLERDFATSIDDYMIAADCGIKAERPKGVLERLRIPIVSELLNELKTAPPSVAPVAIDLYDFSSAALNLLSERIQSLREEVTKTGKAIKAFSIPTRTGGLTYAVTQKVDDRAQAAARAIGAKHKYDTKSDRWYVILDSVETSNPIDALLPLTWTWQEDKEEAQRASRVSDIFKSWHEDVAIGRST